MYKERAVKKEKLYENTRMDIETMRYLPESICRTKAGFFVNTSSKLWQKRPNFIAQTDNHAINSCYDGNSELLELPNINLTSEFQQLLVNSIFVSRKYLRFLKNVFLSRGKKGS